MQNTIIKYISNISNTALMLVVISCGSQSEEVHQEHHDEEDGNKVELTQAQYDQADIQISKIEKRTIASELKVDGVIDVPPRSNISINMPYGGFIKYIDMLPGTKVKKGQLLATVSNPDFIQFQQDYIESRINREYLKAEFERQKKLYDEKVASAKTFQLAKIAYMSNKVHVKTMEERLKLIGYNLSKVRNGEISALVNIYSPVMGSVREVYTNVGKYINPKDVIMDITNDEDLHVELTVYENDIPLVRKGQRIRFTLANSPNNWRAAEVFLVGSGVREDRSVTVHGHLKEKHKDMLPGMYVSAKIGINSNNVWAVSDESVIRFAGKHYVFAYNGQREEANQKVHDFEMLEVVKGNSEDDFVQVTFTDSSLEVNKLMLITKGAFAALGKAKNSEEGGGHGH